MCGDSSSRPVILAISFQVFAISFQAQTHVVVLHELQTCIQSDGSQLLGRRSQRDLTKKICKRMKLPRHRTPGQLHGRLAGFRCYLLTGTPQMLPLIRPYASVMPALQVTTVPSGRVIVSSPVTVFVNERPVPVTLTVSRPSMVTPVDVVHLFVASIVSEASVVHDCRPEGQLMFRDPDTISFPSTQL